MKRLYLLLPLFFLLAFINHCIEEEAVFFSPSCNLPNTYNNETVGGFTEEYYYADLACPCSTSCQDIGNSELLAGASKIKITPLFNNPVYIAGFGFRVAEGVEKDIFARTLVLEYNQTKIAIVALDLVGLFYNEIVDVKIPLHNEGFDYTLIASTHSHSGPDTMGNWGPLTDPEEDPSGVDPEYMANLKAWIIESVHLADADKRPADFRYSNGELLGLTADYRNPQVKDERLDLIQFVDQETRDNIGFIIRWGNHPESSGGSQKMIGPDFTGYATDVVEQTLGGVAIYFSGCLGGMMTPLSISVPDGQGGYLSDAGYEKAEALGNIVGQQALIQIQNTEFQSQEDLAFRAKTYYTQITSPILIAAGAIGIIDRQSYKNGLPAGLNGTDIRTETAMVRIGNAVIATVPGELFPELAFGGIAEPYGDFPDAAPEPPLYQAIQDYPFFTILGLANDELGYIIPKKQFTSSGYEEGLCMGSHTAGELADIFYEVAESLP